MHKMRCSTKSKVHSYVEKRCQKLSYQTSQAKARGKEDIEARGTRCRGWIGMKPPAVLLPFLYTPRLPFSEPSVSGERQCLQLC
jgi:hypothetical protein